MTPTTSPTTVRVDGLVDAPSTKGLTGDKARGPSAALSSLPTLPTLSTLSRGGSVRLQDLQWLALGEEELRTARVAQVQAEAAHQAAASCQEALRQLLGCFATMCTQETLQHHRLWTTGLRAEQCLAAAAFALRVLEACNVTAAAAAAETAARLRCSGLHRTAWHTDPNDWGAVMGTVRHAARAVREVCRDRAEQVSRCLAKDASVLASATSSMHRLRVATSVPECRPCAPTDPEPP